MPLRNNLSMSERCDKLRSNLEREAIHDAIRDFFDRYRNVFVDLAASRRVDREALLLFYSAPLRVVANDFRVVLAGNTALLTKCHAGHSLLPA